MHPDDERHTAFRTPLGVFCYTVMPFGLKNAGATYQRAMDKIFSKLTRKTVECYVDDIAVKSRHKGDHLRDLREVFDLIRAHQLKMNPTMSFLEVFSGKFLGFVVTSKGIHLDPEKNSAIRDMEPQRAQRIARKAGLYPAFHLQSLRTLPTFLKTYEEGSDICVGPSVPRRV